MEYYSKYFNLQTLKCQQVVYKIVNLIPFLSLKLKTHASHKMLGRNFIFTNQSTSYSI